MYWSSGRSNRKPQACFLRIRGWGKARISNGLPAVLEVRSVARAVLCFGANAGPSPEGCKRKPENRIPDT